MKKTISLIAFLAIAVFFSNNAFAQDFSDVDGSPLDIAAYPSSYREANKVARITYSRPQLKGRSIEKLAPKGKVWRTGANEVPEITFYKDVTFGGAAVKAGTYSLVTIPGENEWTVILSKQLNVWGSYFYKESEDVVRVKGTVKNFGKDVDDTTVGWGRKKEPVDFLEYFSISFAEDMTLQMGWGNVLVSVPIQ